jgi:hypothetical protein
VADDPTPPVERDGETQTLLRALGVRKHAIRGFAAGIAVAVAVYVFFVVVPGTYRSRLYYLALAFVLATGVGAMVTIVLVALRARRLIKDL